MSGLYGLAGMALYILAIFGVVMVRDKGLEWRFERELGTGTQEKVSLGDRIERRLGPLGRADGAAAAVRQPRPPREAPPAHRRGRAPRAASRSTATRSARAASSCSGSAWASSS